MSRENLLLEEFGNLLRKPHSEFLEDGIFELRAKVGTDISRLENGDANPTIEMLSRIAYEFGKKLELQFK